ncbi:AMP-dependent synthetase/ligase [Trichothermofontia sp.]
MQAYLPADLPLSPSERAYLRQIVDYSAIQAIPEIWPIAAQKFGQVIALQDPHAQPAVSLTYAELADQIRQFAIGLQTLGLKAGDRIGFYADNSPRWFIADQGCMTTGAVNVVRSSQTEREELLYMLADSGATALIVEHRALLTRLQDRLDDLPIQFIVLLSDEDPPVASPDRPVLNWGQLLAQGQTSDLQPVPRDPEHLATLIYTSGTTGKPKGVMLSHRNLLHQVNLFGVVIQPRPGDRVLSILPSWHAYERTVEYFLLSQGCTQIYTNLRHVKQDIRDRSPNYMVAVPRLWDSIYEGIQRQFREQPALKQTLIHTLLTGSQRHVEARRIAQGLTLTPTPPPADQRLWANLRSRLWWPLHALADRLVYRPIRAGLGGELRAVISGGGSLPPHIDLFFEMAGITILVGYGLTETAPVLTVRRLERNLRGSSGTPLPGTEIKIVDPESHRPLMPGEQGLVLARGPQIMQGYYNNPTATAKAIAPEGWFDTGDLGWVTAHNDIVLTGRAKDTIVLLNGENIEPQPIEDACIRSPYIDQMMLVGQDQRSLGALIVPNLDALTQWAASQNLTLQLPGAELEVTPSAETEVITLASKPVQDLFRRELVARVQDRPGYRPDDRIGPFRLILEPFSIENGMMTQTLKIRRPVVMERYRAMIDGMFQS